MQISQKSYTLKNIARAANLLQPQLMTLPEPKEKTIQLPGIGTGLRSRQSH